MSLRPAPCSVLTVCCENGFAIAPTESLSTDRVRVCTKNTRYSIVFVVAYYGYRYYAPEAGRWVSRDPINDIMLRIQRKDTRRFSLRDELNLLSFCANRQIDNIDILGMSGAAVGVGGACCSQVMKKALTRAGATILVGGGPEDPVADLIAAGFVVWALVDITIIICQNQSGPKPCELINIVGADGTLVSGEQLCVYDCDGVQGFISIVASLPCPQSPLPEDIQEWLQ